MGLNAVKMIVYGCLLLLAGCKRSSAASPLLCKGPNSSLEGKTTELTTPCSIRIEAYPALARLHISQYNASDVQRTYYYNSNPPTSGVHYDVWAAFTEYDTPVDRRFYIHNLEHGAVALLYKCDQEDGCPDVVQGLRDASASLPDDPICKDADEGVRVRTLISPDPLLDAPIVAASWGWTYKAECLDLPSLKQFLTDHYSHGPECSCGEGTTDFYVNTSGGPDAGVDGG